MRSIIKGGTIVTSHSKFQADILINNEKIESIGKI